MKKIILISLLSFLLISLTGLLGQSACEPSDCGWSGPFTATVNLSTTCSYDVDYNFTFCNNTCYYQIIKLYNFVPSQSSCVGSYTEVELMNEAEKAAIQQQTGPNCKPTPGVPNNCVENIKMFSAACWKWNNVIIPNPDPTQGEMPELIPCDNESCCYSRWMWCTDANGILMEPYRTYIDLAKPCNMPTDPDCIIICE